VSTLNQSKSVLVQKSRPNRKLQLFNREDHGCSKFRKKIAHNFLLNGGGALAPNSSFGRKLPVKKIFRQFSISPKFRVGNCHCLCAAAVRGLTRRGGAPGGVPRSLAASDAALPGTWMEDWPRSPGVWVASAASSRVTSPPQLTRRRQRRTSVGDDISALSTLTLPPAVQQVSRSFSTL